MISRMFGNKHIRAVTTDMVEPSPPRHLDIERQLDAGGSLLRSYIPRAEASLARSQERFANAAAHLLSKR